MLTLVLAIKLIAEIALLALFGQWVLGAISGVAKDRNPFYGLLHLMGRPWVRAARWISPQRVAERHLPLVAFLVLLFVWAAASVAKISVCLQIGVALCK
jgi:hypothetical protein